MNTVPPPALNKKKILIVGGGVAGMEAARVAAIHGHAVTLYEKNEKLGGNLIPGGAPDFKEDDHALIRWYKRQLELLRVTIELNRTVTLEELKASNADEIILATGSVPKILKVDGVNMITAEDVLNEKVDIGKSTIIVGGSLVGCETALWLKENKDMDVTIVELAPEILSVGGPLCSAHKDMFISGITDNGYSVKTPDGEECISADSVICAIGYNSNKSLYEEIRKTKPYVHCLGDANKVSNITHAIWDAYELARSI